MTDIICCLPSWQCQNLAGELGCCHELQQASLMHMLSRWCPKGNARTNYFDCMLLNNHSMQHLCFEDPKSYTCNTLMSTLPFLGQKCS